MRKPYLNPRLRGANYLAKLLQLFNVKIDAFVTSNQLCLLNHETKQLKFHGKILSRLFAVHQRTFNISIYNTKKPPLRKRLL